MDWKGPILDDHFHLNRNGRFLDAARDFKRVGGTDLVLVHCPDFASPPVTREGHSETYADTIAMQFLCYPNNSLPPFLLVNQIDEQMQQDEALR